MLLQEPVQVAIWDALNHYAYADATFLAERLFAEVSTEEALYLLATCYYRSNKPIQAYMLLQKNGCPTPNCKYLMARCCMEINKLSEAEAVLSGNILNRVKSYEEMESEYGNMSSHVFSLLGIMYSAVIVDVSIHVWAFCPCIQFRDDLLRHLTKLPLTGRVLSFIWQQSKTERVQKAAECYKKSLKLNPLLWSSFERLCQLGEKIDPSEAFNSTVKKEFVQKVQSTVQTVPPVSEVLSPLSELTTPVGEKKVQTPATISVQPPPPPLPPNIIITKDTSRFVTPENQTIKEDGGLPFAPRSFRKLKSLFTTPLSPSFGLMPLECSSPHEMNNKVPYITPSPMALTESKAPDLKAPTKKRVTRRNPTGNTNAAPKPPVFRLGGNINKDQSTLSSQDPGSQNAIPNVRRSSRLFGSSSSVKENNKSQSNTRFGGPKAPSKKSKSRTSKSQQELNEINKSDIHSCDIKPPPNVEASTQTQIIQMQQQSLAGILGLLQSFGQAYQELSFYNCRKALNLFSSLPPHQYNTGWVLSQVGRAHFECADYQQAERIFSELRLLEPHHISGLEFCSTALWHLQKEVELSSLAQELTEMDKNSPEAWCAAGNCFSLQKEHDTAIKFFQRALQVDPSFAYAYTLLGHEYVFTEELDKAMSCFRNAIRVDPRHYNAWYGVGMIYYKQEKFNLAEIHFRKALLINPNSSALLCHIGVSVEFVKRLLDGCHIAYNLVQHAQQKSDSALITLNKAIVADPRNPLCKFHRASILFATERHFEALKELEELVEIVPKESLVYFLIGKVHKKLGNTHLALMNFSWANDLDPKGINNQIKEAIDKRYVTEDEDSLARLNDTAAEGSVGLDEDGNEGGSRSNSSVMDPEDVQLQAIESDESL